MVLIGVAIFVGLGVLGIICYYVCQDESSEVRSGEHSYSASLDGRTHATNTRNEPLLGASVHEEEQQCCPEASDPTYQFLLYMLAMLGWIAAYFFLLNTGLLAVNAIIWECYRTQACDPINRGSDHGFCVQCLVPAWRPTGDGSDNFQSSVIVNLAAAFACAVPSMLVLFCSPNEPLKLSPWSLPNESRLPHHTVTIERMVIAFEVSTINCHRLALLDPTLPHELDEVVPSLSCWAAIRDELAKCGHYAMGRFQTRYMIWNLAQTGFQSIGQIVLFARWFVDLNILASQLCSLCTDEECREQCEQTEQLPTHQTSAYAIGVSLIALGISCGHMKYYVIRQWHTYRQRQFVKRANLIFAQLRLSFHLSRPTRMAAFWGCGSVLAVCKLTVRYHPDANRREEAADAANRAQSVLRAEVNHETAAGMHEVTHAAAVAGKAIGSAVAHDVVREGRHEVAGMLRGEQPGWVVNAVEGVAGTSRNT